MPGAQIAPLHSSLAREQEKLGKKKRRGSDAIKTAKQEVAALVPPSTDVDDHSQTKIPMYEF